MRVIAGKYKRSNLETLEGMNTRPTKDMVKEALFSSINVEGCVVLDLFSGSGAIGIEALSRGAEDVIFNDSSKDACRIIKSNLDKFKEIRQLYNLDWKDCLERVDKVFDFIYIDPPYAFENYEELLKIIVEKKLLKDSGTIVVEVRKDVTLNQVDGLGIYKEKKYGINKLLYLRKGE